MGANPTPSPEAQAPVNHIGRLFGVLFSPQPTLEDIARRPSWIVPVIVLTLVSLAFTVVFTQRVGWERVMQQQMERSPHAAERVAQLPPDQRQQALARNAQIAKYIGYAAALLGSLVFIAGVSLILMGGVNLILSAGVNYRTAMGITAHAYMPAAIAAVLAIVILFLKSPDTVDLERLVASNLGAFLGEDWPRWLVTLASKIDLFAFWRIILLAMGFAAASPKKVTVGKAFGIIFALYVIYALAAAGITAVFT